MHAETYYAATRREPADHPALAGRSRARVAVVGGGWIGLEVAATARGRDVAVTVVEPAELPLLGALGPEMAAVFADLHREHGVDLRLGTGATAITTDGLQAVGVTLDDGTEVGADAVLVAIGAIPNVEIAEAAGLQMAQGGVAVDASLRTSDPDIFAVGDIAAAEHPLLHKRIRTEHWANALKQPITAAAAMMGRDAVYDELPYFYTDQYDLGMEYVGYAPRYQQTVARGDVGKREFTMFWLDGGHRVLAGMNVNIWEGLDDIKQIRDLDLATSAIWIDRPYASRVNSFDFEPRRFPDPAAMVKAVHAAGLRLALWQAPYLEKGSPDLELARTSGFFPPENGVLLNNWSEPLDLTNPAAYAFWQERLRRYTALGIEGFKLDYAEDVVVGLGSARSGWRFHDGSDERTMHYGYQLLYHRAYAELVPQPREGGGFLLCRTGRWGDQRNVSVIWPGDMDASFTQHRERYKTRSGKTVAGVGGLPATVAQGIGLGASGFPFFGADTGGYRDSPPDDELYRRWLQQTALSTVMQVGDASSQPPWEYNTENGRSDSTLANYRTYARLHLRLFPYEWTYAQNLARDGRPIQRAVGLVYPELGQHPMDEYLFGDDLLVAPVLERGARERSVLLPPGVWFDWDDGTRYAGGQTVRVAAPLDKLPLFVRGGGLVPLLRPDIDTLSPATQAGVVSFASDEGKGPLVVRAAPGGEPTEFVIYDGTRLAQQRDARALSITPGTAFIRGARFEVRPAPPPAEVRVDGALAPRAMTPAELEMQPVAFRYDAAGGGTLTIQLSAGSHVVEWK